MKYDNFDWVFGQLRRSQSVDRDRREKAREVEHFLDDPDGQWEPGIIQKFANQPRYTFDQCNPIVEDIWSAIAENDFDIRVRPAGGDATKEIAKTYDGLIRNIETISNAFDDVYSPASKQSIRVGFDAFRVKSAWADADSFEQDLFIEHIENSIDRVWFDQQATKRSMDDARFCFVLTAIQPEEYEERWPEGSKSSVGDPNTREVYTYKKDKIVVGEFIYKKPVKVKLHLLRNGAVISDEKAQKLGAAADIIRSRERESFDVYVRHFDGAGWLGKEKKTVFDHLPVIPVYANFKVSESKVIYYGAIEKLIDAQRVYNYAQSRAIRESALSPKQKVFMTQKQAAGHEEQLRTMNTNNDPVQFYNADGEAPPPYQTGGAQTNPALGELSHAMIVNIERTSGQFAVNPTNNRGLQSNVALERLENKGNQRTLEYFKAIQVAINQAAKVLIHAIPRVYDTARQRRIMNEDGSFEMAALNTVEMGEFGPVVVNDLSQGVYDVTTDIGPAFKNRQQEAVRGITDLAAIDPSIVQLGKDIMLNQMALPGMDILSERVRRQMFEAGLIPQSQLTEEEAQEVIAAQQAAAMQGAELSPIDEAQLTIAQAEAQKAQAQTADIISKTKERDEKIGLEAMRIEQKDRELAIKAQQEQQKIDNENMKVMMQSQAAIANQIKALADGLNSIREAMGATAVINPTAVEAYQGQAELLTESQDRV